MNNPIAGAVLVRLLVRLLMRCWCAGGAVLVRWWCGIGAVRCAGAGAV
jgi:hypothetical protein